jgi:hypothetical protein
MMAVTNAAAEVIREWLRCGSGLHHPTIYLGQGSDTPAEIADALKRRVSQKELRDIAQRALKSEPKYLLPLVYPGWHFVWITTTIEGFRFASRLFYPPSVRRAMKNGVLDAAERGLVLKDEDGTVVLPTNATGAL